MNDGSKLSTLISLDMARQRCRVVFSVTLPPPNAHSRPTQNWKLIVHACPVGINNYYLTAFQRFASSLGKRRGVGRAQRNTLLPINGVGINDSPVRQNTTATKAGRPILPEGSNCQRVYETLFSPGWALPEHVLKRLWHSTVAKGADLCLH